MSLKIKERLPYIFAIFFLLLSVGGFIYLNYLQNGRAKNAKKIVNSLAFDTIVVSACEIFSLKDAQNLLSKNVEIQDSTVGAESTADIDVSACSYSIPFKTVDELAKAKTSSVFLRSAKTIKGANINHQAFTVELPKNAQPVEGYGQNAYWNPDRSQLNVYKDGNWLIFSSGSLNVNQRTIIEAKKLADVIMPKI